MSAGKKVIHVKFKSGEQHYFGSIAAIYEQFDHAVLGITRQSLYDYGITPEKPYKNKLCTINHGEIARKKGNRRKPGQQRPGAIFSI